MSNKNTFDPFYGEEPKGPPLQEQFSTQEKSQAALESLVTMEPELLALHERALDASYPNTSPEELTALIAELERAKNDSEWRHFFVLQVNINKLELYKAMHSKGKDGIHDEPEGGEYVTL